MWKVFGIRHHGPGSARSLRQALESYAPDAILVEGPPDAQALLPWLATPDLQPPVAILIYVPDQPQRSVYYPFAVFSPEWQALQYGLEHALPVRFMDLPQTYQLAAALTEEIQTQSGATNHIQVGQNDLLKNKNLRSSGMTDISAMDPGASLPVDPISWLAAAAGYPDSERWWEHQVEQRRDGTDLFAAILELMTTLRHEVESGSIQTASAPDEEALYEARREAYMRQTLRQAQADGYERIAVVCGAWHAPALVNLPPAAQDEHLLKGLARIKVAATWAPWSYGRLCAGSGYGAGIESPGWYHHLWECDQAGLAPTEVTVRWMTRVAHLLRGEDLDAAPANVIEAVRLAEALAALRGLALPGLPEMNEAVQAVFFLGSDVPLRLVHERLIVSDRLGCVPEDVPVVPLQADLTRQQKRLRLSPQADWRDLDLDLRQNTDLDRSYLLHRLDLLEIPWGRMQQTQGKSGTFHELWRIQWQPEFAVTLIEAGLWGNTVAEAASNFARYRASQTSDLAALTELVGKALLADLPLAIYDLLQRLESQAAIAADVGQMMDALPPLADVQRYGNVRGTDTELVGRVTHSLVSRVCIGLPLACAALDDDAARQMFARLLHTHQALLLLQNDAHLAEWQEVLYRLADNPQMHGLIAGRSCRILLDRNVLSSEEAATRLGLALSTALEPVQAANWIEGFLKDSGALLVHDPALFALLDQWLASLTRQAFVELLPLLRRTFAGFTQPERRMIGERARSGATGNAGGGAAPSFDPQRAAAVLPRLAQLLGAGSASEPAGSPAGEPAGSPVENQSASTRETI